MGSVFNCSVDEFRQKEDKIIQSSLKPEQLVIESLSRTLLARFIADKTGVEASEVAARPQFQYLHSYLLNPHVDAKTMVTEYDYIDQHFLDDYSKYFSQCFAKRSRLCMRVHFFSEVFDEPFLYNAVNSADGSIDREEFTKKGYLGYFVIRPLEQNFLSKICLMPYKGLMGLSDSYSGYRFKLIRKPQKVSLFGIPIEFETLPMREQDQVISACASTAIWTALSASNRLATSHMPALSSITSTALGLDANNQISTDKTFLTPVQVERALSHYGFFPRSFIFKTSVSEADTSLQRLLDAYVSANIAVMISGQVHRKCSETEFKEMGDHIVSAVGYRNPIENDNDLNALTYVADTIDRCYAHDDRYGPFLALDFSLESTLDIEGKKAYKISKYKGKEEFFCPTFALIACPPGLNLGYADVESVVAAFLKQIEALQNVDEERLDDILGGSDGISTMLDHLRSELSIRVVRSNDFKRDFDSSTFFDSSICQRPEELMIENMPKFLWSVSLSNEQLDVSTSLYFDASEIAQGSIFFGYVAHSEKSLNFWHYLSLIINYSPELKDIHSDDTAYDLISHGWKAIETEDFRRYCRSMKNQLASSDMELDALYGKPRLPRRNLHLAEVSKNSKILSRDQVWNVTRDGAFSDSINQNEKYNWVVDEFGDLICAFEISDGEIKVGHPTVIGDRKARIAGELYFDAGEKCWLLNSDSGAYSRHLWDISQQGIYLKNVYNYLFQKFDFDDLKIELINFTVRESLKHKPDQWRTIVRL